MQIDFHPPGQVRGHAAPPASGGRSNGASVAFGTVFAGTTGSMTPENEENAASDALTATRETSDDADQREAAGSADADTGEADTTSQDGAAAESMTNPAGVSVRPESAIFTLPDSDGELVPDRATEPQVPQAPGPTPARLDHAAIVTENGIADVGRIEPTGTPIANAALSDAGSTKPPQTSEVQKSQYVYSQPVAAPLVSSGPRAFSVETVSTAFSQNAAPGSGQKLDALRETIVKTSRTDEHAPNSPTDTRQPTDRASANHEADKTSLSVASTAAQRTIGATPARESLQPQDQIADKPSGHGAQDVVRQQDLFLNAPPPPDSPVHSIRAQMSDTATETGHKIIPIHEGRAEHATPGDRIQIDKTGAPTVADTRQHIPTASLSQHAAFGVTAFEGKGLEPEPQETGFADFVSAIHAGKFSSGASHTVQNASTHTLRADSGGFAAQVADIMIKHAGRRAEIALQPEELGRVRLTLSLGEAGASVMVSADRPETLDLMRRHSENLAQSLRSLGHADVSFSFQGGNDRNQPIAMHSIERDDPPAGSPETSSLPAPKTQRRTLSGGLDIRL